MFGINVEYKKDGAVRFPEFTAQLKDKKIFAVCDINTEKYLLPLLDELKPTVKDIRVLTFHDEELVPDEHAYGKMEEE